MNTPTNAHPTKLKPILPFLTSLVLLLGGGATARASFTLVALPDTQYYSSSQFGGLPAMYTAQTDWIQANRSAENIAYVASLGDMTDHGNTYISEWQVADDAMSRLESPVSIPYGACVGNHDQTPNGNPGSGTTAKYNTYFGVSRFSGRSYYGGHYGADNDSHYDLFSADGNDYIVIYIEYDGNNTLSAVRTWAANLCTTYSNRKAIIVSHSICDASLPYGDWMAPEGQSIFDAVKAKSNVFLMLSGHVSYVSRRQDQVTGYHVGQVITTLTSNYQFQAEGGGGYLRLYDVDVAGNTIRSATFSPYHNAYNNSALNAFQVQVQFRSRIDVFFRGTDDALYWKHSDQGGAWSAPMNLGGALTSDPAACSRGAGMIDVFYRGANNTLRWRSYENGAWSSETDIGDVLVGRPAACSPGTTHRLDIVYRGSDNHLKHRTWSKTTGAWSALEDVGGDMGSDPAVASWGPYRLDVFYRGRLDDDCHHYYKDDLGSYAVSWTHEDIGGNLVGMPGVSSGKFRHLDVYAQGTDNKLYHKYYDYSYGWSASWTAPVVTGAMTTPPEACAFTQNRTDAFYKQTDGHLWHTWWNATSYNQQDLGAVSSVGGFGSCAWSRF